MLMTPFENNHRNYNANISKWFLTLSSGGFIFFIFYIVFYVLRIRLRIDSLHQSSGRENFVERGLGYSAWNSTNFNGENRTRQIMGLKQWYISI